MIIYWLQELSVGAVACCTFRCRLWDINPALTQACIIPRGIFNHYNNIQLKNVHISVVLKQTNMIIMITDQSPAAHFRHNKREAGNASH